MTDLFFPVWPQQTFRQAAPLQIQKSRPNQLWFAHDYPAARCQSGYHCFCSGADIDFESLMLFFEQLLFDLLFQLKRRLPSLKSKCCWAVLPFQSGQTVGTRWSELLLPTFRICWANVCNHGLARLHNLKELRKSSLPGRRKTEFRRIRSWGTVLLEDILPHSHCWVLWQQSWVLNW